MRCLVTGGAGFIGSSLVKELVKEGWDVEVVDDLSSGSYELLSPLKTIYVGSDDWLDSLTNRTGAAEGIPKNEAVVPFFQNDFADKSVLRRIQKSRYDVIFHQAAIPSVSYSVESPVKSNMINLHRSLLLFKAAADSKTPVVWASSSAVYGGASILPTVESQKGHSLPKSPYAMQKYHLEDYSKLYADLYELKSIGLRYFNVFGPGQLAGSAYATAVSAWCHAIKHGLELRSDGDGEQTRDMCYIDNVVHANIQAAQLLLSSSNKDLKTGRCYNIACGKSVSNNQILEALKNQHGDKVKINHAPRRIGDVRHTLADISRAQEELDYKVKVHFWEGLELTIKWWEDYA